ncbi:unnamed protein product [Penicillium salamii]|nr:unnamed protein product [Penicillium salamii]CAG8354590.1 unnamed protein product [Penicillium salamii]
MINRLSCGAIKTGSQYLNDRPPPHQLVTFLQSNSPATVISTLYLSNLSSGQLSLSPYQPASFPFNFLKRATIL